MIGIAMLLCLVEPVAADQCHLERISLCAWTFEYVSASSDRIRARMAAVFDLEQAVDYLKSKEVTVAMGIQDFPICRIALIADPDGNTLALHQRKPNHPEFSQLQSK